MENFTQVGLFISRFYQKLRELCQLQIMTKQRNLSANTMFPSFTSVHHVYLIVTKKTKPESQICAWLRESSSSASWISRDDFFSLSLFVTRESALLAMETKFHLRQDSGQGFTQIIPYPAGITLP